MTRPKYHDYLKTDHWRHTRAEALRNANYKCSECGTAGKMNVHHLHYRTLYNESIYLDLAVLCESCHFWRHNTWQSLNQKVIDYCGKSMFA